MGKPAASPANPGPPGNGKNPAATRTTGPTIIPGRNGRRWLKRRKPHHRRIGASVPIPDPAALVAAFPVAIP
jgi:hypothetical protein